MFLSLLSPFLHNHTITGLDFLYYDYATCFLNQWYCVRPHFKSVAISGIQLQRPRDLIYTHIYRHTRSLVNFAWA